MKRIFDFVASLIGFFLLIPVLLVCSILIVVDDGFPILFKQKRVGRYGRDFNLFKFRTMIVKREAEKGSFDVGSSARVTSIGRLLRKTKLDELPQLWNVIRGDMSLVGPRPEVRKWVDVYPEEWERVHTVRPGITDSASIKFRNEEEILSCSDKPEQTYCDVILPQKLSLYTDYVNSRTFWGDIKIIFQTLWAVISK